MRIPAALTRRSCGPFRPGIAAISTSTVVSGSRTSRIRGSFGSNADPQGIQVRSLRRAGGPPSALSTIRSLSPFAHRLTSSGQTCRTRPVISCEWILNGAESAACATPGVPDSHPETAASRIEMGRARLTRGLHIRMCGPTLESISKSVQDARAGRHPGSHRAHIRPIERPGSALLRTGWSGWECTRSAG